MTSSCCLQSNTDTGRLFSWMAGWNRLRHRVFGFEPNQRQLLDGIRAQGIDGASLLEVGCGPGYLHQTLVHDGADHALGLDLSAVMLDIARQEAARRGLQTRCDYRQGDVVQIADELPEADVTILDKVVCCYPDWQAMLHATLPKTRRIYALTYPLDRSLTRVGIRFMSRVLDGFHCRYRPYLHDPQQIQGHIARHGFRRVIQQQTSAWLTEIYLRSSA